jgi:peptidyl-dipeptidase A
MRYATFRFAALLALPACATAHPSSAPTAATAPTALRAEVESYLESYDSTYKRLYYASQLAQWASNTHIVAGDSTNAVRSRETGLALSRFVGSIENINRIKGYLTHRSELDSLQLRRLEIMQYYAADAPQSMPDVVRARLVAENAQVEQLYGYQFMLNGKPTTPNAIDNILHTSSDLAERHAAWESSKDIGPTLKDGLAKLRDLRNRGVKSLGYPDFFAYNVSDYQMSASEMLALNDTMLAQLRPLYRELHTWARYELAKRYHQPVPDMIPADWLPNRWGQSWEDMVHVEGLDVDSAIKTHDAEWVVRQGEKFYVSLGFDTLPTSFWKNSSLYALPANAPYKKNTHASAWHLDLDTDIRSLESVEPNTEWYETVHHELGHVYYFRTYTRPDVPLLLRAGANRAYHEGIGTMMQIAAGQRRFLVDRGLASPDAHVDSIAQQLKEALNLVVVMPFASGVMTHWEHDLYANDLPADQFNARWWEYVKKYQGIVPPEPRGEQWCDACTKTHISDDPAQYYDYALSTALLVQLHLHIARDILHQDPHDTDYYGSRATGDFLRSIMRTGETRPWRDVLRETTGRALDAQAMVEYFAPLYEWLKVQNRGRTETLPD